MTKSVFLVPVCVAFAFGTDFSAWSRHMDFSFNTSATGSATYVDIPNFPVLIRLDSAQGPVFAQARAGGADVRFTKSDGTTPIPFEIESWDATARAAEIWVLMDTLIGDYTQQSVRMYWNNPGAQDASNGTKVFSPERGFAAVWHFSRSLLDATGNGNHGVNAGTTDTGGVIGRGRAFHADSLNSITVPHSATLNITGNLNISAWINSLDWGPHGPYPSFGNRRILQKGGDGEAYALREQTDRDSLLFDWGGALDSSIIAVTPDPDTGKWHLIHATYDGYYSSLYIDGDLKAEIHDTGSILSAVTDVIIGGKPGSTEKRDFFQGMMDEIRLQDVIHNQEWFKCEYANQRVDQVLVKAGSVQSTPIAKRAGSGAAPPARASAGVFATGGCAVDARGRLLWRFSPPPPAP